MTELGHSDRDGQWGRDATPVAPAGSPVGRDATFAASAEGPAAGAGEGAAAGRAPLGPAACEVAERPARELTPHELGARGELVAAQSLRERAWEILERNWRCPYGEVDIIARDPRAERVAVLVEVKTRLAPEGCEDAIPELAVDLEKQQRYRSCALDYLLKHGEFKSVRFDVIAITVAERGGAHLRHLMGAYSVDG